MMARIAQLKVQIAELEAKLRVWHRNSELSRRLAEVPSIGPIGASLLAMKVIDPGAFRCGRDFAAWLGLTAKDHSSGTKRRLGGITRAGDAALRSLLIVGATAVVQQAAKRRGQHSWWLMQLVKRKPAKVAAVALANKTARIVWKLMVSGERYNGARHAATGSREGRALRYGGSAARPSLAPSTSSQAFLQP
jgi:transposase